MEAVDPDADSLTVIGTTIPSWLSFSDRVLSGTPTALDEGVHSVHLSVTDGSVTVDQEFNIAVFPALVVPVNLIVNPSFESGTTGWNVPGGGWVSVSTDTSTNGISSLRLSSESNVLISATTQEVPVTSNTNYELSFWVLNAAQTSGTAVFDLSDKPTAQTETQQTFSPGTASVWTRYSGIWNSGSETVMKIRIFTTPSADFSGTIYFDEFSLSEISAENAAPVITSVAGSTAYLDQWYRTTVVAVDEEESPLVFSGVSIPDWLD
ncbi:MAG: carbohydrate binding domain-containing protein, partial [Polyangiaceae bacterium]|nr:carbohydrate binding domain-containing protein [Polyangiaceae bacterium]